MYELQIRGGAVNYSAIRDPHCQSEVLVANSSYNDSDQSGGSCGYFWTPVYAYRRIIYKGGKKKSVIIMIVT